MPYLLTFLLDKEDSPGSIQCSLMSLQTQATNLVLTLPLPNSHLEQSPYWFSGEGAAGRVRARRIWVGGLVSQRAFPDSPSISSTHTSLVSPGAKAVRGVVVTGHVPPGVAPVPTAEGARVDGACPPLPAPRAAPRSLTRLEGGYSGGTGFKRPRQTFGGGGSSEVKTGRGRARCARSADNSQESSRENSDSLKEALLSPLDETIKQ